VRLVGFRYVPGVRVSGRVRVRNGRLVGVIRLRGGGARRARIGVGANGRLRARFSGLAAASQSQPGTPLRVPEDPPGPVVGAGPVPKTDF